MVVRGSAMNCQRCGRDTHVRPHRVDGYIGLLCRECYRAWERRLDAGTAPRVT